MDIERAGECSDNKDRISDNKTNLVTLLKEGNLVSSTRGEFGNVLPSLDIESFTVTKKPQDKNSCEAFPPSKTQKDSLDSTIQGESTLSRIYEVSVLSPQGQTLASAFEKVYGQKIAAKMKNLGVEEIVRRGDTISLSLKSPLHYGDDSGSIDVATAVSFDTHPTGSKVKLENITGVSAKSGFFEVDIHDAELQPRTKGYLTGVVKAGPTEATICAVPDGSIFH
jgi:hypothetical protein